MWGQDPQTGGVSIVSIFQELFHTRPVLRVTMCMMSLSYIKMTLIN